MIRGRAGFGLAYPRSGNPDRYRLRIGGVTSSPDGGGGASAWAHRGRGVATGLITAFVAIGVAQLVAGFTGPQFAPVIAVGGAAIDNAPPPVKNFAISAFGSNDKRVLVGGILVVLAVFAALIGVAALRRLAFGLAGLAVFTLIGLLAALTRPDSSAIDALPVLIGAAAGAYTMSRLVKAASATERALSRPPPPVTAGSPDLPQAAGTPPGATAPAAVAEAGGAPGTGASWVPAGPPSRPVEPAFRPGRRAFLITGSVGVGIGWVSALIGQRLAGPSSAVVRARTTLRIPPPAHPAPPLPAGSDLPIKGLSPFITPNARLLPGGHRDHPAPGAAGGLAAPDPRHGATARSRISFADLLQRPLIEN